MLDALHLEPSFPTSLMGSYVASHCSLHVLPETPLAPQLWAHGPFSSFSFPFHFSPLKWFSLLHWECWSPSLDSEFWEDRCIFQCKLYMHQGVIRYVPYAGNTWVLILRCRHYYHPHFIDEKIRCCLLFVKLARFTSLVGRGGARNRIEAVCFQNLPGKGYFRPSCRINVHTKVWLNWSGRPSAARRLGSPMWHPRQKQFCLTLQRWIFPLCDKRIEGHCYS